MIYKCASAGRASKYATKHSYMITTNVTPEMLTEGSVLHRVYVKKATTALKTVQEKLIDYKPERVGKVHWYSCDKQKIIDSMNAISE